MRRLRLPAEAAERRREALRVGVVGEVAGVREDLEAAVGHRRVGRLAVVDGDDRVAFPPHDQARHQRRQPEPVVRADPLAARVDHRAHRVQERLARAPVVERGEALGQEREVAAGREPQALQHAADAAARAEHAGEVISGST